MLFLVAQPIALAFGGFVNQKRMGILSFSVPSLKCPDLITQNIILYQQHFFFLISSLYKTY